MDLALADRMPPPGVGADEPAERPGTAALTGGLATGSGTVGDPGGQCYL